MRYRAVVDAPTYDIPDLAYFYMVVVENKHFLALTTDRSLANWIAGQANHRSVIKVEEDK